MYELIFSVIILLNGKISIEQTRLHSFGNLDQCVSTRQYIETEMRRTAKESGTLPGLLECRKTI